MERPHFNVPPGWPVPTGWEPPPGFEPDPSWPPAPRGWSFWTTESAPPRTEQGAAPTASLVAGSGPTPPAQPATTEPLAIGSLIGSFVFAPVGIVLGHMALNRIKVNHNSGKGLAQAGLVIGYLGVALLAFWLIIGVSAFSGSSVGGPSSNASSFSGPERCKLFPMDEVERETGVKMQDNQNSDTHSCIYQAVDGSGGMVFHTFDKDIIDNQASIYCSRLSSLQLQDGIDGVSTKGEKSLTCENAIFVVTADGDAFFVASVNKTPPFNGLAALARDVLNQM